MKLPPVVCRPSGPLPSKIVAVGEAPGEQEALTGLPFIGTTGQELRVMMKEVGIDTSLVRFTNVFQRRPDQNKIVNFCVSKKETGLGYRHAALSMGKYIHPDLLPDLDRLKQEIIDASPNLIIALGGTAAWALLNFPGISKIRGTVADSSLLPGVKVLPTFHPSYVVRNWQARVIVLQDLLKAERESHFPTIRRPHRRIHFDPSTSDLVEWRTYLLGASRLSTDIETKYGQITCIGFAPSRDSAFVFPFWDPRQADGNYWRSLEDELACRAVISELLASPIPKIFQNGLYDMQYLLRDGYKLRNVSDDTMILHHALFPEMRKDLGFLGSVYTNEASWKLMRTRQEDSFKRDE